MSDNIYVLQESSSEYETSSEEDEGEERVKVVQQDMKFYENTNYVDNTLKYKSVIMDYSSTGNFISWEVIFKEPLIIHKICDIYLDNITTVNALDKNFGGEGDFSYLLLGIDEFNVNNSIATGPASNGSSLSSNKIMIPNDMSVTTGKITQTHKSKKLNYVSTIQPTTLHKLTGTITGLGGDPIWFVNTATNRLIAEFIFQFRN